MVNCYPPISIFYWIYILFSKAKPLVYYAEKLLQVPADIQFFFHAGETNWMGTSSDENLVCELKFYFSFELSIKLYLFTSLYIFRLMLSY